MLPLHRAVGHALRAALVLAAFPALVAAQGTTVSGTVRDSLAHAPLTGAMVQLVAAEGSARFAASATSDGGGRYAFSGVPDGAYMLGFFHPLLDSLGVAPRAHALTVAGGRQARADLATPSAGELRTAICHADAGGLIVGVVHDARTLAPLERASVTGQWLEYTFTKQGVVRRTPRLTATTGDNGWFALCNVPPSGTVTLRATNGADSTDVIEQMLSTDGFARRELFLGAARSTVVADSAREGDSLAVTRRTIRRGDGRLSGVVTMAAGGGPLAGALASIPGGPSARANERGEWTIADAPAGTRMLEVRAVGYYPERRAVDVAANAPPVRTALFTLKSVLDTIKVTAARFATSGFEDRRRSGAGRYLTREQISRHIVRDASDVLKIAPGVRLVRSANGVDKDVLMTGPFGLCTPALYINGQYFDDTSTMLLDAFVSAEDIVGVEIYTEASAPPQYGRLPSGANTDSAPCGSIVVWTR